MKADINNDEGIMCSHCNILLEASAVQVVYLSRAFPTQLLKCPVCGLVYVPEDLALGKMAEVERTLEEK